LGDGNDEPKQPRCGRFPWRIPGSEHHRFGIEAATINTVDMLAGGLIALGAVLLFVLGQ